MAKARRIPELQPKLYSHMGQRTWAGPGKGHSRHSHTVPASLRGFLCLPPPLSGRFHPSGLMRKSLLPASESPYLWVQSRQGSHKPLTWYCPVLGTNGRAMPSSWAGRTSRLPRVVFLPVRGCREHLFLGFGEKTVHGGCQVFGLKVTAVFSR